MWMPWVLAVACTPNVQSSETWDFIYLLKVHRERRRKSLISSLCGRDCWATEIEGPFVKLPNFPEEPPVFFPASETSLFAGVRDRRDKRRLSADLEPSSVFTPTANSSRPDSWADCGPPGTKRARLTTPRRRPAGGGLMAGPRAEISASSQGKDKEGQAPGRERT